MFEHHKFILEVNISEGRCLVSCALRVSSVCYVLGTPFCKIQCPNNMLGIKYKNEIH